MTVSRELLLAIRKYRGSMNELADKSGVSQSALSSFCLGRGLLSLRNADKLAGYLKLRLRRGR